jgi:hypothetical protein
MNNDWLVPYKVINFLCQSEIQDGHLCWSCFLLDFFFKKVLKILLPKTSEPLKANMDWMFTAWFLITIVTLYYTKIKFVTDILYV